MLYVLEENLTLVGYCLSGCYSSKKSQVDRTKMFHCPFLKEIELYSRSFVGPSDVNKQMPGYQ